MASKLHGVEVEIDIIKRKGDPVEEHEKDDVFSQQLQQQQHVTSNTFAGEENNNHNRNLNNNNEDTVENFSNTDGVNKNEGPLSLNNNYFFFVFLVNTLEKFHKRTINYFQSNVFLPNQNRVQSLQQLPQKPTVSMPTKTRSRSACVY